MLYALLRSTRALSHSSLSIYNNEFSWSSYKTIGTSSSSSKSSLLNVLSKILVYFLPNSGSIFILEIPSPSMFIKLGRLSAVEGGDTASSVRRDLKFKSVIKNNST